MDIKITELPCYPDDLPDLEANEIDQKGDYGCEGCEHFVVQGGVYEGVHKIGDTYMCDKGVWNDEI